jgi:hypothetical protein
MCGRQFFNFLIAFILLSASFSILTPLIMDDNFGLTMTAAAAPPFSGGNGSVNNPFQIMNVSQLQNMSANLSAHYVLVNDIDCTNTSSWDSGKGFVPIGNSTNRFNGSFDGQGFNITNLYFNVSDYYRGLFGYTNVTVQISNVTLINVTILGGKDDCGGLVGYNQGTITNCHVNGYILDCSSSGYVQGYTDYCGGLVGSLENSFVDKCNSSSIVNGTEDVGGLIGAAYSTSYINNSYSTGTIYGTSDWIGGFIGYLSKGTINNSFSTSNIIANTSVGPNYVGGFAGENNENIINSYSLGNVLGPGSVGGFVGSNSGLNGFIRNCYATGNVTGTQYDIGGLVGYNTGTISYCNSTGNVNGTIDRVGGLVGYNNGPVTNCESYGIAFGEHWFVGGLIGMNFNTVSNCTSYGNTTASGVGSIVLYGGLIGQNNGVVLNCSSYGYTYSSSGNYFGGLLGRNQGTVKGSHAFGNTGLNNNWVGGLVGENMAGALIENCSSIGIVTGKSHVGGLVGYNLGEVTRSYCTGDSTGTKNTGGLIGINFNGLVTDCYSQSKTSGSDLVGGLVGNNTGTGTITNCYSNGSLSGTTNFGGLIGNNTANVTNCFWDNETSSQLTSDGGTGKNTTDMMKESTFTGAGWDFVNIWGLVEGKTYPFLWPFYNILYYQPRIITEKINSGTQDVFYSSQILIDFSSYPAGNKVVWNLSTNAESWLSLEPNGLISGTPTNDNVGTFWVNVTITDVMGNMSSQNYSLIVFNINDVPLIITGELDNATEDISYQFNLNGTDIDPTNDILDWSMNTDAGWLNINPATGELNGLPTNDDVGTYWVNIILEDNNTGMTSKNLTLIVNNVNDAPLISTVDITTADEDVLYGLDYDASDIDPTADSLTWTYETDAGWLNFNSITSVLFGTPGNDDVGIYWVNVTVYDGNGGSDSHNFSLTVNNINDPPVITNNNTLAISEDSFYYVDYEATDVDPTNDTLTWTLDTDAEWLSMESTTGTLSGTPTNDNIGTFQVNVTVTDGNDGYDWTNFSVAVSNVNDPPSIITEDILTAKAGELYSMDYEATDIDPTQDTLTWSLETNASSWLSIDSNTGILSGTPTNNDVGIYWVNVSVKDGEGGIDFHIFAITVEPGIVINQNPVITTTNILNVEVNAEYSVDYEATDDRTPIIELIWMMDTNASWLTFNASTRVLSGTPEINNIGSYWVNITVEDGEDGFAYTNFTVTVKKPEKTANNKPELTDGKTYPDSGDTGTEFTFSVTYTDSNNDSGEVWVWIDDDKYRMTPDPNDTDFTDGIEYTYVTKLGEGDHTYYFAGTDGKDDAESGDSTTPTNSNEALNTPTIKEPEEKKAESDYIMLIMAVVIILIIFLIILAIAMRKRKPEEEAIEGEEDLEVEEEEELEDEELGDEVVEDSELEDEEPEDEEPEEEETYECPDCGADLGADDTVCSECGAEFEDEEVEE